MSLNTEPLRKILDLEEKRGYTDTAVIGGLDRFLSRWASQNAATITSRTLLRRFNSLHLENAGYASLTPEQRQQWIGNLLEAINQLEQSQRDDNIVKATAAVSQPINRTQKQPAVGQSIDSPISVIKGISQNLMTKFDKLGVKTVRDLLYFFPNRHLDYSQRKNISQITEGNEETIIANVWQAQETRIGNRRSTEVIVGDETGNIRIIWFNNPYLARQLKTNTRLVISGRVSLYQGRHVFESPEWELVEDKELIHTGRLVPLYPLTQGLRPRQVRKLVKDTVDQWAVQLVDFLPSALKERCHLLDLHQAITQAHYPADDALKDRARTRLAFDELFLLQLGVLSKKRSWQEEQPGNPIGTDNEVLDTFRQSLPFELTPAQDRSLDEVLTDISRSRPMSRLLQGEVGSGKTVVATAALLMASASGYQGAFMAPTEILAEQHYLTVCQLLSQGGQRQEDEDYWQSYSGILSRPLTVALLIGGINQARKRRLQQLINDGKLDIIIGTHALIQKEVAFSNLGLAVIDEQHRFGVEQRSALRQKGYNPHILVMTATPIPRTLALTLYGDLDLSVIDQLPPGRQTIRTKWLQPEQRNSAYAFLRRQVAEGNQAFIICPLIEESETVQARAAVAEFERLSEEVFPDLRLGLLHGKMSTVDKDRTMRLFRAGQMDILVATSVVEVGIDIPNATVMLVESADRFGLSQLHQFRGRVGRGQEQSYCMLLAQNPSEIGQKRLDVIEKVDDGFQLAEEDLKLRGPGEFFGTRQSGLPDLRMAKLSDVPLLELARQEAIRLFKADPQLEKPEHLQMAKELVRVWPQAGEWS